MTQTCMSRLCLVHDRPALAPGPDGTEVCTFYDPHLGASEHYGCDVADARPCLGGCGRLTNGEFDGGTHGPGPYCGWCHAVPASPPRPLPPSDASLPTVPRRPLQTVRLEVEVAVPDGPTLTGLEVAALTGRVTDALRVALEGRGPGSVEVTVRRSRQG